MTLNPAASNPPAPLSPHGRPPNKDLLVPWLIVAAIFGIFLIIALAAILYGMAQVGIAKTILPWWYHPLIRISESGLILSAIGILALVIISIRRASKDQ
jgi:hypothetical protein